MAEQALRAHRGPISNATGQVSGACVSGKRSSQPCGRGFQRGWIFGHRGVSALASVSDVASWDEPQQFCAQSASVSATARGAWGCTIESGAADFDQDGRADLAVLHTTPGIGNIDILQGDGSGLTRLVSFTADNEPTDVLAADA